MNLNAIQLNEVFGPTYQGEGKDIGKPCFFIRTQGCPVQCPGCDTAFTWDGTEKGETWNIDKLRENILPRLSEYPGCGVVVSGGEPLIHYLHTGWIALLAEIRRKAAWLSVETSGFIGKNPVPDNNHRTQLIDYLRTFTTVHCSPKITPCLRGPKWSDADMNSNMPTILAAFSPNQPHETWKAYSHPSTLAFKYVVRDRADMDAVLAHVQQFGLYERGHPLFLMPYGIERDEVAAGCDRLLPWCAQYGFRLSPRLHTLLWGNKRGV